MTTQWTKFLGATEPSPRTTRLAQSLNRPPARIAVMAAIVLTAALFTAGLRFLYEGQRRVMIDNGGFCASGGPYEIADGHQCTGSVMALTMGGFFAMLVGALALVGFAVAYSGARAASLGLVLWGALFGALGYNFIALGLNDPQQGTVWGWLIPGIMFWVMALPGIPALLALVGVYPPTTKQNHNAALLILLAVGFAIGYVAASVIIGAAG